MSEKFWEALRAGAAATRKFTDELWKVWRWFGIGMLGLHTYDAIGDVRALIFGLGMSVVGLVALASWIFGSFVPGVTKKGRASGALLAVLLALGIFILSIYFAIQLWVIVALLAQPVFLSQ
ncbi:hypothetical protein MACH17_35860 [Phaeobacter inhibens]|uniref:hypothetical protein n=1 Tax=Phaeobacter inhibens TaxID=221822 RepID=UPI00275E12D0|nr:hypothetical protein [Phaeobacter inhibens]GLO72069.1 hypothetical protein MACH17_35860 [Phaeobacter inhibens]